MENSYWRHSLKKLREHPSATLGLTFLTLIFLLALIGPMLTPYSYFETHLELKNLSPSKTFWFGTDELGRDLFARVGWGARISLCVGVVAALGDVTIGVLYGSIAALCGGKIDLLMMRFVDILNTIPYLLIVILLMVIMGTGLMTIIFALILTGWFGMARMVRGQIIQLKTSDFILAATAVGSGPCRILFRHLLPNLMGMMITALTITIPTAIFAEAFLSFLGLGIQAPIASWGTMASDGLSALRFYPWRLFFPAACISLTMLGFNLLGDGIRDAFDPKVKA